MQLPAPIPHARATDRLGPLRTKTEPMCGLSYYLADLAKTLSQLQAESVYLRGEVVWCVASGPQSAALKHYMGDMMNSKRKQE